jgi:hypothetical protein
MIGAARKKEIAIRDERIAAAYRSGASQKEIAECEGISRALVSIALKKMGARLDSDAAMARWREAGRNPEVRRRANQANLRPIADRFLAKAVKGENSDDCWAWSGAFDGNGYAQIRHEGRNSKASHVSLALDGRPRENNLYALHTCDNPACTNPKHLWWGTQQENMQDALKKGRSNLDGLALGLPARLAGGAR